MPPPSQLAIKTSALNRLIKEEKSYHKELEQQQSRIAKLESTENDDENAEYMLRQERTGVEETKKIFPELQKKISNARDELVKQLEQNQSEASQDEIDKAKAAIAAAEPVE